MASDPHSLRFDEWRRSGSARPLAELFDELAPELLRIALHLSGRPDDAEDLLQSTFLAALEGAAGWDGSRPVVPWMVGILRRQAVLRQRRRAREAVALSRIEPPSAAPPGDRVEAREFDAETWRQVDELPEPYRQPVLLKLRAGLTAVEIAHLLGRSPGNVRVQIHRGLERLRRSLGPRFALPAIVALGAPRSLAAVKEAVLSHAATLGVTATAAATIPSLIASFLGASLVSKTSVLATAAAVVVIAAATYQWLGWTPAGSDGESDPVAARAADDAELSTPPAGPGSELLDIDPLAADRDAGAVERIPLTPQLVGTVRDAASGEPLGGVTVRAFGPRATTVADLVARWSDQVWQDWDGTPRSQLGWLHLPESLPAEVLSNQRPIDMVEPPDAEASPQATAVSDADGRFTLPRSPTDCILAVDHEGWAPRLTRIEADQPEASIELHAVVEVRGTVIDVEGQPVREPVRLMFRQAGLVPGWRNDQNPALEAWSVETQSDGTFQVSLPRTRVTASSLTRGWTVTNRGIHPERQQDWIFATSWNLADEATEVRVVLTRISSAYLEILDAATEQPVEQVRLLSYHQGFPRHCGFFSAPQGLFAVEFLVESTVQHRPPGAPPLGESMEFVVWTDQHVPQRVQVPRTLSGECHRVLLEAGECGAAHGEILRGGRGVGGAAVELRAYHHLNWRSSGRCVLDRGETDEDGAFELSAPPGSYLLVVRDGDDELHEPIHVPDSNPVRVDLLDRGFVEITILDATGLPRAGHNAAASGGDGEQLSGKTDENGVLVLGPLRPGPGKAFIPKAPTDGSWGGDQVQDFELAPGQRLALVFHLRPELPPARPFLRLTGSGLPGFDGWRARDYGSPTSRDWVDVAASGHVPLEIEGGTRSLQIEAPSGRRWTREVPPEATGEYEVSIAWSGAGYRGRLVGADGGLAGVRVFATAQEGEGRSRVSATTDAEGCFELIGLPEVPHQLTFNPRASDPFRVSGRGHPLTGLFVSPRALPADPPTLLELDTSEWLNEEAELVTLAGTIQNPSGQPIVGALVAVASLYSTASVEVFRASDSGWKPSQPGGRFEVAVPRAPRYQLSAFLDSGEQARVEIADRPGVDRIQQDLRFGE